MIQSLKTRLQGQKVMEKTMVVMVFLLLVGLSQASLFCEEDKQCRRDVCIDFSCKPRSVAGGPCDTNSHCVSSANSCINEVCSLKSPPGGTCDANDGSDCAVASSTCSSNICLSPTDGQCSQNNQCALSSDSCIGQLCEPKGTAGETCDANDNADCVSGYNCVASSCSFDLSSFKWEGNTAMAKERTGAASVAVGGFLFVFGGNTPLGLTDSVEMYDPSTNTWVSKANVPVSTWKHSVVAVGNFVYLIGGAAIDNSPQNNFLRYDTVSNQWAASGQFPNLPAKLHSMAATVVGSTIFTLGGQSGEAVSTAVNNIYSFNTDSPGDGWSTTPFLPITLTQASAVTVGSMIYVTGGVSGSIVQTKTIKYNTANPLVFPQDANLPLTVRRSYHASFYNPISNKIHLVGGETLADKDKTMETLDLNAQSPVWTAEPTAALYQTLTSSSGGLINNRFYLPGTTINPIEPSSSNILNVLDITSIPKWVPFAPSLSSSFYGLVAKVGSSIITAGGYNQFVIFSVKSSKYSISSDTWSALPDLPASYGDMGSAVVGSEVYSFGGFDESSSPLKETYALNAGQTAWVQKASLNFPRYALCAASQGNRIFAFGGTDISGNILDTMEIYDATLNTWTDVTTSSKSSGFSPSPAVYCAAVSTGTKILIFGGENDSGVIGNIQSFDIASETWDAPITTSFITARENLSATVLNGFVIVSGGISVNTLATVEAYEISTGIVTTLPDLPTPRYGHGSVTDGDSVFVVGGFSGGLLAPLEKYRSFP